MSSSAPVASRSCSSWSATCPGDPTNCVSMRSATSARSSSVQLCDAGLVWRRVLDGALAGPDAAHPQPVTGRQVPRGRLVAGNDHVGGNAQVRPVKLGGRPERGPVAVRRLQHGRRADVVISREPQPVPPGHSALWPPLLPRIHTCTAAALARNRARTDAVGRGVGAAQQGQDVVYLLAVILGLRVRQLQQLALQGDPWRLQQRLRVELRRDQQPVRCPPVDDGRGRSAGPAAYAPAARRPDRPSPRSSRPGCSASIRPNSSTVDSAVR